MRIPQAPRHHCDLACERPLSVARPPSRSDIPSDGRPHLAIVVALFGLQWLRLHRSPVFLVRLRQAGMESVRTLQTFRTVPRSLIIDPWLAAGSTWPTDAGDPRPREVKPIRRRYRRAEPKQQDHRKASPSNVVVAISTYLPAECQADRSLRSVLS
jgi:hypothetical protein